MRVRLKVFDGYMSIDVLGSDDVVSNSLILQPGERFHGWKYSRLARMGAGDHDLISKRMKNAQPTIVLNGGAV